MGVRFSQTYKYGRVRLRKDADTGIWQAKFLIPEADKYLERTTGSTTKKEAQKYVDNYIIPKLIQGIVTKKETPLIVTELFNRFIAVKRQTCKKKGIARYETSFRMFLSWLKEEKKRIKYVKDISVSTIDEFRLYRSNITVKLTGRPLSKRTIDDDIKNLSTVFRWGISRKFCEENPADCSRNGAIDLFRAPEGNKPVYSKNEYNLLLREAIAEENELIHDIIVVLANTGMRFGELASLKAESLNFNTGTIPSITVKAIDDFTPKDKNEVKVIPMLPKVEEVLQRRIRMSDKTSNLFLNSLGNVINPNNTRKSFYRLMRQVGINRKKRPLNWHSWRRYFIKNCVEAGIPINAIRTWTGHDSVSMVLHYLSLTEYSKSVREIQKLTF